MTRLARLIAAAVVCAALSAPVAAAAVLGCLPAQCFTLTPGTVTISGPSGVEVCYANNLNVCWDPRWQSWQSHGWARYTPPAPVCSPTRSCRQ